MARHILFQRRSTERNLKSEWRRNQETDTTMNTIERERERQRDREKEYEIRERYDIHK